MNAITVPIAEAQTRLSELVAAVAGGADVTLTEGGAAVARLVAAAGVQVRSDEQVAAAIQRIHALRDHFRLEGSSLSDLVKEGRRV